MTERRAEFFFEGCDEDNVDCINDGNGHNEGGLRRQ